MTFRPIDFASWKLTLPVGRPGHPTEIMRPTKSVRPWYVADLNAGELLFRAPANGVTTEGSKYPRSELRELNRSTGKLASWPSQRGVHDLWMAGRITHLTDKHPNLVCAQIHDGDDDVLQVRLEGPRLFLESDGDERGVLDADYPLGEPFRLEVTVAAGLGGIQVSYWPLGWNKPEPASKRTVRGLRGSSWFFKAGCYLQSNVKRGEHPGAYGEVAVRSLVVRHR